MRSTITTASIEFSKEELIGLLVEISEINFANAPAKGEHEKYPLLKKFETVLNDTHSVGEISSKNSTFKLIPRQ